MAKSSSSPLESLFNKVYTSRWNPLYQSGALALFLFLIVAVSGLYLLLFYDVGAPHESVEGLWSQVFFGRWIRSLHRYASDAAVVAIIFHVLKMVLTGRTWGTRARAWVSGWLLVLGVLVCGWTGFVLVWDGQAQWIALEASRIMDALPLFTAPLPRIFSSGTLPSSFFFSLLFLHVAVPLGLLTLYLVHVSKVARPTHKPPLPIRQFTLVALLLVSVLWPVAVQPAADLSQIVGRTQIDLFYTGFLPLISRMPAWAVWVSGLALLFGLALAVPLLTRPKPAEKLPPSWVDPNSCTGCTTCFMDCPYEAITMVKRSGETAAEPRRSEFVALVNPDICVSCGICAGSCAPMGVGPPLRTGKAQMLTVKEWFDRVLPLDELVVIACDKSFADLEGSKLYLVSCIGSLHTSVIEYLIRKGASGVFVLSCPERDCHNREGPKWSRERIYNDREAELQARVDRRRVRTAAFSATEMLLATAEIAAFRAELEALKTPEPEKSPVIDLECEEKIPNEV